MFNFVYPDGSSSQQAVIEVHNHDLRLWNIPPQLQQQITNACSFPTDQVVSEQTGWRPPGAELGEKVWDGWRRLAHWPQNGPGNAPTGLLPLIHGVIHASGYPYRVDDARRRPEEGCPDVGPLQLFPYQREAADHAVKMGRGVLDMPPRSGKTRTGIEITRMLWLPTIWIAPTTNIVTQTVRAFDECIGRNFAVQIKGTSTWRQHAHAHVIVCTAATAAALPAEFYATREVLFIDEVHHGASPQYHHIARMARHIYFRFGMTGTFFRSEKVVRGPDGRPVSINDDMALHALISTVIYKVETTQLVAAGRLVPTSVAILPVLCDRLVTGGTYSTGPGKYGIWEHDYRNKLASWAACVMHSRKLRVLILVATKEQGVRIAEDILESLGDHPGAKREFRRVEWVSTARPAAMCQKIIDSFAHGGEVEVLVGTSMVGEGTDIPECDALVYACGQKAEVSHRQAMFRVATALPHKRKALIVDFDDRHHRALLDHSVARVQTYRSEPTARVDILGSVEEFPQWADWILRSRVHHR